MFNRRMFRERVRVALAGVNSRSITAAALTAVLASAGHVLADNPWSLKRDRDGIQVYTRSVEGSPFKAVRSVTEIETSLSSIVALIRDTDACANWADRCGHSSVFRKLNGTEAYIYTLNDMPWPVADRDVLAHVRWSQDKGSLAVTMLSDATTGEMEKNKGVVRLTDANARWYLTPIADGKVRVVTEAHVNPGGPLPAWVINMLLVDSPFKTLLGLRKAVNHTKYQNAKVSFIVEPAG